jgi:hypothetical protein
MPAAYAAFSLAALLEVQGDNSGPPLFVMRSSNCFPGFAFLFLSAADGHWPRLYCVGSGMHIGELLLNVWFRLCSCVVGSSNVSEFA